MGLCDGQVKVLSAVSWAAQTSWTSVVTAKNDGSAIGLGSAFSSCSVTIGIVQSPLPPVITTLTLYTSELVPVNTLAGNLTAVDPAGYTITNFTWAAVASPNSFSISLGGSVTFAAVVDTLALSNSVWSYSVNVCNPYICGRCVFKI